MSRAVAAALIVALASATQPAVAQGITPDSAADDPAGPPPFRVLRRVAIDAGHGGAEPGCIGVAGVPEKELTLATSRALAAAIADRVEWVGLSREGDDTVTLEGRTAWANLEDADVLLSVHYNCALNPTARGVEVYYLHPSGTIPGEVVPGLESRPTTRPVVEVGVAGDLAALIVEDLRRLGAMWLSAQLADHLQAALLRGTGMVDRGVRQAQFRVLRGARMPAVVAELGFLTHPVEGKLVFLPERREAVVTALVEGLERFDAAQAASVLR